MKDDIPIVPFGAIRYLHDVHDLLLLGRLHGPLWRFRHPVRGLVTVLNDNDMATDALASNLRVLGWDRFTPWLGHGNPLAPIPSKVTTTLAELAHRFEATDTHYHLEAALRPAWKVRTDVGPALRDAALAWLLDIFGPHSRHETLAAAKRWRAAARTYPLLVPALRGMSRPFNDLVPAKLALLQTLSASAYGHYLDGPVGTYFAGAALTLLGPVADALAMVAMSTLAQRGDPRPSKRVALGIASAHPMPLVLLEAPGEILGVDLVGSGLPFGIGYLAAALGYLVRRFLGGALEVASELDLAPAGPVRNGRVRLCVGPVGLDMSKWTG